MLNSGDVYMRLKIPISTIKVIIKSPISISLMKKKYWGQKPCLNDSPKIRHFFTCKKGSEKSRACLQLTFLSKLVGKKIPTFWILFGWKKALRENSKDNWMSDT